MTDKTVGNSEILYVFHDEDDGIWDETGVITEQGSGELRKYGMGDVFGFPKPTYLIKKILIQTRFFFGCQTQKY